MKAIGDIVSRPLSELRERQQNSSGSAREPSLTAAPPLDVRLVTLLWVRMSQIYGHRWTSSYSDDPAGGAAQTWARGLAGLDAKQIAQGVERCLIGDYDWPPTLPEFRKLCFGIPTLSSVLADVQFPTDGKPTPFIRLVWRFIDAYNLKRLSMQEADREIKRAYEKAREHVMQGKPLPEEPIAAIEHEEPERKPAAPEVARAALAEMAAKLRINQPEESPHEDQENR